MSEDLRVEAVSRSNGTFLCPCSLEDVEGKHLSSCREGERPHGLCTMAALVKDTCPVSRPQS